MYPITRYILVACLLGASGGANARVPADHLEGVAGKADCRAPLVCTSGVKPRAHTPTESGSHVPPGPPPRVDAAHSAAGSDGHKPGDESPPPGSFTCGEVIKGYTVTCTPPPVRRTFAAPEIDPSLAVGSVIFVIGALAIINGRRRRVAGTPIGR